VLYDDLSAHLEGTLDQRSFRAQRTAAGAPTPAVSARAFRLREQPVLRLDAETGALMDAPPERACLSSPTTETAEGHA
jgi:hypothetical protein